MDYLDELENESLYIIREAYQDFKKIGLLWSIGKDSTTLLWLIRKAFFGDVPFPVIHLDTAAKYPEMYAFREKWAKKLGLNLIAWKNQKALDKGIHCCMDEEMTCCKYLKTEALK
ncbi:MAG: phosphoadenosine phosphosulfate reductase family protein, partial [Candidatus Diapherotrites archaeon]|nr:phosphoadenosine phosphosulfate reductase family protein [Candidatus Diapherotrites archaeon]